MSNSKTQERELALTVNGEPRAVMPGATIAVLLQDLGIVGGKVAVEHNKSIAPRSRFDEITLSEGDQLEIVRFVGGG